MEIIDGNNGRPINIRSEAKWSVLNHVQMLLLRALPEYLLAMKWERSNRECVPTATIGIHWTPKIYELSHKCTSTSPCWLFIMMTTKKKESMVIQSHSSKWWYSMSNVELPVFGFWIFGNASAFWLGSRYTRIGNAFLFFSTKVG